MPDPLTDTTPTLREPRASTPERTSGHAAGEMFNHQYRLASLLGTGGMGEVWRAQSLPLGIDVALKLIRPFAMEPETVQRLRLEARAMARVTHPSAARVFDVGTTEAGEAFLVMELVQGEPLSALLAGAGRLEERVAIRLALALADVLAAAHAAGIVHRDLKPSNVLVEHDAERRRWVPRLIDFGIARLTEMPVDLRVSSPGMVLGSPRYMAPEQALGRMDIDGRADVWALALMLYEMIAGHHPFATLPAVLVGDPEPTTRRGGDPELWSILRRGLAHAKEARWPTMEAFGAALAAWAVDRGVVSDAAGVFLPARWLANPPASPEERSAVLPPPPPSTSKRARASRRTPGRSRWSQLPYALAVLAILGALADRLVTRSDESASAAREAPADEATETR